MSSKVKDYDYKETLKTYKPRLADYYNKDENGKKFCLFCGKYLTGRKKLYCSDRCWHDFYYAWCSRYSWEWIRERVLIRDNYTCQKCGRKACSFVKLEVHHIKPRAEGGTDDDDNLITYCRDCHKPETAKLMKKVGKRVRLANQKRREQLFWRCHKKLMDYIENGGTYDE